MVGGALSRETQLFMSTVLAPIIQGELTLEGWQLLIPGYGLTETCGMTSINTQDFKRHGTVGVMGPSTECKLQGESYHLLIGRRLCQMSPTWDTFPPPILLKGRFGLEEPISLKGRSRFLL
jgi:long-subunit acyl-CoA synthetase (AMP-forming)